MRVGYRQGSAASSLQLGSARLLFNRQHRFGIADQAVDMGKQHREFGGIKLFQEALIAFQRPRNTIVSCAASLNRVSEASTSRG